jgi:hypothetical protein
MTGLAIGLGTEGGQFRVGVDAGGDNDAARLCTGSWGCNGHARSLSVDDGPPRPAC